MRIIHSQLAIIAVFSLMGCGDEIDKTVPVSGTVKIDGKAVSTEGYSITFVMEARQSNIDIKADGTFSGEANAGKGSVKLHPPSGADGGHGDGSGEGDEAGDPGDPVAAPPTGDATYSNVEVEVKSGMKFDLNFKKK